MKKKLLILLFSLVGMFLFFIVVVTMLHQVFRPRQGNRPKVERMDTGIMAMPNESATNFTSNLPIVVLHTGGQHFSKNAEKVIQAEFYDINQEGRASLEDKPSHSGLLSIELRGHTSLHLP